MSNSQNIIARRRLITAFGKGAFVLSMSAALPSFAFSGAPDAVPQIAVRGGLLKSLGERLAAAPRRRAFKTVRLIVTDTADWDHEAATEVLAYKYEYTQAWDNADLAGPWLGLMREAMNGQTFMERRTDFLAVSATHGLAHLALFSQSMWDKYALAGLTGGKASSNTFITEAPGVSQTDDLQKPAGFYGPANNNIVSLQKRGAVFIACHDSIHAIARMVHGKSAFAGVAADEIAADLTNNLIPGAVLVPSVVAFLVDLQHSHFTYVKT